MNDNGFNKHFEEENCCQDFVLNIFSSNYLFFNCIYQKSTKFNSSLRISVTHFCSYKELACCINVLNLTTFLLHWSCIHNDCASLYSYKLLNYFGGILVFCHISVTYFVLNKTDTYTNRPASRCSCHVTIYFKNMITSHIKSVHSTDCSKRHLTAVFLSRILNHRCFNRWSQY